MGYNTSVIVLNDALDNIGRDPAFGNSLAAAISQLGLPGARRDVSSLGHCNAATVIETHHADQTSLVSFGGNCGIQQMITYGWEHNSPAMQAKMCAEWADKLGYRLVRKPTKFTPRPLGPLG